MPESADRKSPEPRKFQAEIAEIIATPEGRLALMAISGLAEIDQPVYEGSMRRIYSEIALPLSLTAATKLVADTENMTREEKIDFTQKFIASLNTLWRYAVHEEYFRQIFKKNSELLELHDKISKKKVR